MYKSKKILFVLSILLVTGFASVGSAKNVVPKVTSHPSVAGFIKKAIPWGAAAVFSLSAVAGKVIAENGGGASSVEQVEQSEESLSLSEIDGLDEFQEFMEKCEIAECSEWGAQMLAGIVGVNGTDNDGYTPLDYAAWWASYRGDIELARELVAAGADIRGLSIEKHRRPFDTHLGAAAALVTDRDMFLSVAEDEGGIDRLTKEQKERLLEDATRFANKPVVEALLDHGTDPNAALFRASFIHGMGTLKNVVHDPRAEILSMLLDRGGDVNLRRNGDGGRTTPLHLAVYNGNLAGAEVLLKRGADPNIMEGWTSLHAATIRYFSGLDPMVEMLVLTNSLLVHGADARVVDDKGLTPYDYAVKEHKGAVAADKKPAAATAAILLQEMGVDMDAEGRTPEYWAQLSGRNKTIQELIERKEPTIRMPILELKRRIIYRGMTLRQTEGSLLQKK